MIVLRLLLLGSLISLPLYSSAPKQQGGPAEDTENYTAWCNRLSRTWISSNDSGIKLKTMFYAGTLAQNDRRDEIAQQQLAATQQQNALLVELLARLAPTSATPATGPQPIQNADGTLNFLPLFHAQYKANNQGTTATAAAPSVPVATSAQTNPQPSDHKSS